MRVPIETERLILRPFEAADAQAAYGWFGDPVVMRFTPGGPDKSIEETTTRLANYQEHQIAHGFSKWITLDRRTKLPVGNSGLPILKDCGWKLHEPSRNGILEFEVKFTGVSLVGWS